MGIPLPGGIAASDDVGNPVPLAAGTDLNGRRFVGQTMLDAGGTALIPFGQGYLSVQDGPAEASLSSIVSQTAPSGLGSMTVCPAVSGVNGTPLGSFPSGGRGVRLYLPPGSSVVFTTADSQPSGVPTATFTVSASGTGPNWDENLSMGQMLYLTATSGTPLYRWI